MVDDSADFHFWSLQTLKGLNYPGYDYGFRGPFDYSSKDSQPKYVDSFEENLVLLGDIEGSVDFRKPACEYMESTKKAQNYCFCSKLLSLLILH